MEEALIPLLLRRGARMAGWSKARLPAGWGGRKINYGGVIIFQYHNENGSYIM